MKLIFLDLDGTLLRSNKTISEQSRKILRQCQKQGHLIAFCTARGETNVLTYIDEVHPDIVISSAGAMVRLHDEVVYQCAFTTGEARRILHAAWTVAGKECHITLDAPEAHYANFHDPFRDGPQWGYVNHTSFIDWDGPALKICVELENDAQAQQIAATVSGCSWIRFSDGQWYKFTLENATKETAIAFLMNHLHVPVADTIAFGDDFSDIGMLKMCGCGVAMANAIPEVKQVANAFAGDHDQDGVARYLEEYLLTETKSGQ